MQLLTMLTIIYVAVLVLALAASLITISVYLFRIGSGLADVNISLGRAETNTAPLAGHIETINGGFVGVRDGLKATGENLASVSDSLSVVAAKLGVGSIAN